MTDEQKRQIIELYPHYSGREIGDKIGLRRTVVNAYAKKMGITHTPEAYRRIKHERTMKGIAGHSQKSREQAREKNKRTRLMETYRLLSGDRQKTKLKISILPQKTRRRITMLCHLYNYFKSDDRNSTVVYYDSETRRNAFAEKYAHEKYGITFEEGE